jgi:hypothetical protein
LPSTGRLASPSTNAPQLSEGDKKKLKDLADEPEVQAHIQDAWDKQRHYELNFIYRLNIDDREHVKNDNEEAFATDMRNTGSLYNNPMLQRYLNAIGQKLVPKDSPNLYSFRLVLNPVPYTHAYSTGTVLVSTGMVSILDNESQLAYVLAREIAHIERGHLYEKVRNDILQKELNEKKEERRKQLTSFFGSIGALLALTIHNDGTEWPEYYEDEADSAAVQYMLNVSYDARETLHVFEHLETITTKDPRVTLGNSGTVPHLRVRRSHLQELLSGDLKTQIEAKLMGARLTGSGGEFAVMMAALKRDNGIIAFNYDLFAMSRENLEDAVALRSNDARAQLYLGKVISVTARDDADRLEAEQHFVKAIQCDENRGAYPDPHLEHAQHLIGTQGDKDEVAKEVEAYIDLYQRENGGKVPGNMPILYDYLNLSGNTNWYAAPVTVISTKNVESVRVNSNGRQDAPSVGEIVRRAAAAPTTPPAQADPAATAPAHPKAAVKRVVAK